MDEDDDDNDDDFDNNTTIKNYERLRREIDDKRVRGDRQIMMMPMTMTMQQSKIMRERGG